MSQHGPPLNLEFYVDPAEDSITSASAERLSSMESVSVSGDDGSEEGNDHDEHYAPTLPDHIPAEPILPRSVSPAQFGRRLYGGRSTPAPSRYRYQPSTTGSSSYFTGTDAADHHPWHRTQSFVAVDPFHPSVAQSLVNLAYGHVPESTAFTSLNSRPPTPTPPPPYQSTAIQPLVPSTSKYIFAFLLDTLPRQIYLHVLLTLPSLYFSRVARIFEDAELSMPDIKKMAVVTASQWKDPSNVTNANWNFEPSNGSPHFSHLKTSWEHFIDSLNREWKTLNLVSVLLLS